MRATRPRQCTEIGLLVLAASLGLRLAAAAPDKLPPGQLAERYYKSGQYDKALAAFQEAYVSDPRPIFLYNAAQSLRQAGRAREAEPMYEQFLREETRDAALRAKAQGYLTEVRAKLAAEQKEAVQREVAQKEAAQKEAAQKEAAQQAGVLRQPGLTQPGLTQPGLTQPAAEQPVEGPAMAPEAVLNGLLQALLLPDENQSVQATLRLVHRSLMNVTGDDLRRDVRPYSFRKARFDASFYYLPVRISRVDPPRQVRMRMMRPNLRGAQGLPIQTEEVGTQVTYYIERRPDHGGPPALISLFFPQSGGPPKVLGLGSI